MIKTPCIKIQKNIEKCKKTKNINCLFLLKALQECKRRKKYGTY